MTKAVTVTRVRPYDRAKAIAAKTEGAYSFDRYSSWTATCYALVLEGYTDRQVEAIVLSKWSRWAADAAQNGGTKYGKARGRHLVDFVRKQGKAEVVKLEEEHFA